MNTRIKSLFEISLCVGFLGIVHPVMFVFLAIGVIGLMIINDKNEKK